MKKIFDRDEILKLFSENPALGITTNLQQAKKEDVVLYNLTTPESINLFHKRLKQANPSYIIVNKEIDGCHDERIISYRGDFKELKKSIAEQLYPLKSTNKYIGITGTNGKSSTVDLVRQILGLAQLKTISMGTMGVFSSDGKSWGSFSLTTPDIIEFHRFVHQFQNDYQFYVFEVSSHALEQDRLFGIKLDYAGWTNFTQDHLDFHGTMENYFQAKLKIARLLKNRPLMINNHSNLLHEIKKEVTSYEVADGSLLDNIEVPSIFECGFMRENLILATNMIVNLLPGIEQLDFKSIKAPLGRMTLLENNNHKVMVDYAHTPDALECLLKNVKNIYPKREIILVFGCGGDRDNLKRPIMGKIAHEYGNYLIITNDNPRTEEPQKILDQIIAGIEGANYKIVPSREKAIKLGLEKLSDASILIIAGKGHEDYQEINGIKYPFSDIEIVENYWRGIDD